MERVGGVTPRRMDPLSTTVDNTSSTETDTVSSMDHFSDTKSETITERQTSMSAQWSSISPNFSFTSTSDEYSWPISDTCSVQMTVTRPSTDVSDRGRHMRRGAKKLRHVGKGWVNEGDGRAAEGVGRHNCIHNHTMYAKAVALAGCDLMMTRAAA